MKRNNMKPRWQDRWFHAPVGSKRRKVALLFIALTGVWLMTVGCSSCTPHCDPWCNLTCAGATKTSSQYVNPTMTSNVNQLLTSAGF